MRNATWILVPVLFFPAVRSANKDVFQFIGRVVPQEGETLVEGMTASLHSMATPFSTRTTVYATGEFKFKNLTPGMYTLIVIAPRTGALRRTIEISPSLADAGRNISSTFTLERRPAAGRSFRVSTAQLAIPDAARQEYQKGMEYLEKRETERAAAAFEKALQISPQFLGAHNRLGIIAFQSENYDAAELHFREALKLNSSAFSPLVNLGGVLLAQGRVQESLEVNLRAAAIRPDDPLAQAQLGYSYFFLGRPDEAEPHLKRAKQIEVGHFSFPQLLLADIYGRQNKLESRVLELEEFLKLHPDSKRSPEARKSLEETRALLASPHP